MVLNLGGPPSISSDNTATLESLGEHVENAQAKPVLIHHIWRMNSHSSPEPG